MLISIDPDCLRISTTTPMVAAEEHAQVLAEELEVLESIYIDELESACDNLTHRSKRH